MDAARRSNWAPGKLRTSGHWANKKLQILGLLVTGISTVRPPEIAVGKLRFTAILSALSSSFIRQLYPPSSLNGTRPKPATCSEVSPIWKCMSDIWVIPSLKIGGPKSPFSTTSRLNSNFNGLPSERNIRYTIEPARWKLQGVFYIVSKCHKLLSTNGLKFHRHFHPPSVNSAFYFITRLRTRFSIQFNSIY